jgi:hypothetical protein
MVKKSFILYDSYYEILKGLSDENRGKLMSAIFLYVKEKKEMELEPIAKMAFNFIKLDIDRNDESYERKLELNRAYYKEKKGEKCKERNHEIQFHENQSKKPLINKENPFLEKNHEIHENSDSDDVDVKKEKEKKEKEEKEEKEELSLLRRERKKKEKKDTTTACREPSGQSPSALGLADKPQVPLFSHLGVRELPHGNKSLSDGKDNSCHIVSHSKDNSRNGSSGKSLSSVDTSRNSDKDLPTQPRRLNPHVQMFEAFKALYQTQTQQPYHPRKEEFVALANLMRKYGANVVDYKIRILHAGCKNAAFWFTKKGFSDFTIRQLVSRWNELVPFETQEQKDKRKLDELLKKIDVQKDREEWNKR